MSCTNDELPCNLYNISIRFAKLPSEVCTVAEHDLWRTCVNLAVLASDPPDSSSVDVTLRLDAVISRTTLLRVASYRVTGSSQLYDTKSISGSNLSSITKLGYDTNRCFNSKLATNANQ